jgi:uncharacterized protein
VEAQKWMTVVDQSFGQGLDGGFAIVVPRREDVPAIEAKLRAIDAGKPVKQRLFDSVVSLDDIVPKDQPAKIAVLAQIRALLTSKDIEQLDDDERAELEQLTPPEVVPLLRDTDIPDAIAWPFIESDLSRGKILLATIGKGYEVWDTRDTTRWAAQVRGLGLPDDVHLGGASFVFADVIAGVLSDGPRATLAAALGAILIVLLVIGPNRFGAVTIACGLSGTILMLGISALLGLKVNFLDFVALPITLGLGVDYAINVAHRHDHEEFPDPITTLRTSGSAVFVCSLTTIIGYGSLLVSDNLAIKGFGTASLIGEITCVLTALVLVPALLAVGRCRR